MTDLLGSEWLAGFVVGGCFGIIWGVMMCVIFILHRDDEKNEPEGCQDKPPVLHNVCTDSEVDGGTKTAENEKHCTN